MIAREAAKLEKALARASEVRIRFLDDEDVSVETVDRYDPSAWKRSDLPKAKALFYLKVGHERLLAVVDRMGVEFFDADATSAIRISGRNGVRTMPKSFTDRRRPNESPYEGKFVP